VITLQPSKSVLNNYSINFDALSIAFSSALQMIYGKQVKGKIRITKSKGWDHYLMGYSEIRLSFDVNKSDVEAITTIIHELRHWQQDEIFKLACTLDEYDPATFETYHNSVMEIDARHFQKVETQVLKLYTSLVELSKKNDIHVFSSMYQRVG
jgi:hypothetical protein